MILCILRWSEVVYHNERVVEIDYLRNLRSPFYLLASIIILRCAFIHDSYTIKQKRVVTNVYFASVFKQTCFADTTLYFYRNCLFLFYNQWDSYYLDFLLSRYYLLCL